MNMDDLKKMSLENPNDYNLGEKVRQIAQEEVSSQEETNWKDLYLRASADLDNFRKRVLRDKEELVLKTKISMMESILDIDSDIAIAASHSDDEGIKLIVSKLEKFLSSQGIEVIQTDVYDENIHEVVSVIPSEDKNKKIHQVISKGYKHKDKIIRYPKIIITGNIN